MPYYHKGCGGEIGLLTRKCKKCGHKWGISAWFQYPPPKNMTKFIVPTKPKAVRGKTDYAKWADNRNVIPGVAAIASLLPNIPRWARITVTAGIITAVVFVVRAIF